MQTSTDPLVHATALEAVALVNWPRYMIPQLPLQSLDLILSLVADCFQDDGNGRLQLVPSSAESIAPRCGAFLFLFWENYALDVNTIYSWTMISGRNFVENRMALLDVLRDLGQTDGHDLLYLFHVTLKQQFNAMRWICPSIETCSISASSPMEAIHARTIFYMAQFSIGHRSLPSRTMNRTYDMILDAIAKLSTRTQSHQVRSILLSSFAISLGYDVVDMFEYYPLQW